MTEDRLAELYRSHGPAIFARCLRLLRDRAAAEDATQETFLKVFRHLARAPGDEEVQMWIFRIATNVCLSQIRQRVRRQRAPLDAPPLARNTEELMADRDLALRIVAQAPEKLSLPAWLHYVDGIDQVEIGRMLGISRRTVINRLAQFNERALRFVSRTGP
jgi:RNA polymerase sigma-70 factor (ECF subfamily)